MTDTQLESEIGPVAWAVFYKDDIDSVTLDPITDGDRRHGWRDEPLYPQARIDADATEKAELLARVKELEDTLEPFAEFIGEGVFWDDGCPDDYVFLIHDGLVMRVGWVRRARAALASKKETVDE